MNIIVTIPKEKPKFMFYDLGINETFMFAGELCVKTGSLSAISLNVKGEILFTKNMPVHYVNIETSYE